MERPMSRTASGPDLQGNLSRTAMRLAALVACAASISPVAAGVASYAQAPAQNRGMALSRIPELGSAEFAWLALGVDWLDPPSGLRGPVKNDPNYPRHGNRDGPGQVTP